MGNAVDANYVEVAAAPVPLDRQRPNRGVRVDIVKEARQPTPEIRTYHHGEFPTEVLLEAKGDQTVSVCLPARNEATTIGEIVAVLRREILATGVADEILVIDDHSTDRTAAVARAAGARVVSAADILAEHGRGHGKGEVLWKSLFVADGDIIVWCDADISRFSCRFVRGVLGPLLCDDAWFSKGHYRRHESDGEGGGRVTELVARPLLSMFFPELTGFHQPLSGEYGGRREMLEQVPFVCGYGVDIGLLIDLSRRFGIEGMAQVDLDVRHHRNRPLSELSPQATAVAQTVIRRADPGLLTQPTIVQRPDATPTTVTFEERPAMNEVATYLARPA
jgi:glucosyl-3-phosphoglycerate synthase